MRTFRAVRGLPVVTLAEGGHAGKVDDFLFSLANFSIYGFKLRAPGFWSTDTGVATDEVERLGRDYVLVSRESAIESSGDDTGAAEDRVWWSAFVGIPLLARRGAQLGKVEDVLVEEKPRRVVALLLDDHQVVVLGGATILRADSAVIEDEAQVRRTTARPDSPEWWQEVAALCGSAP